MSTASSDRVDSLAEWRPILSQAAAEVFSLMVGAELAVATCPFQPVFPNVTGTVGIAGAISALLSLGCSTQLAVKIAARMLGVPADDAAPQHRDAIGELCNIVAGQFKAKLGLEDKCMLSVPTVITGGNYHIHSVAGSQRLELTVLCEGEPIWIAVETRH